MSLQKFSCSLSQSPSTGDNTFFLGEEELPKWVLFGDEWIELDESMLRHGDDLCPECKELGYCKRDNDKTK